MKEKYYLMTQNSKLRFSKINFFSSQHASRVLHQRRRDAEHARVDLVGSVPARHPRAFPHQHGSDELPAEARGRARGGEGREHGRQLEGRQAGVVLRRRRVGLGRLRLGQPSGVHVSVLR
jgi:hypothetical protein